MLHPLIVSPRLGAVRYDIRGALNAKAVEMELAGQSINKLNIGNPAIFGFRTPVHIREAVIAGLPNAEAYGHQQGLLSARESIVRAQQARGVPHVHSGQVFIGNGCSELIDLSLRALLHDGDEVLIPAPDYPLWTAAVLLNGGVPKHYPCDPLKGGHPDPQAVEALITPRTKALVLINPNNPTGSVYPPELVRALCQIAERHGLIVMSDEIYESLLFDEAVFQPAAPLVHDTLCLTFMGLSKIHRACGYRGGWLSVSGSVKPARDYLAALDLLSALRLCSNVPAQLAISAALEGPQSAGELCVPGGRLHATREVVLAAVAKSNFLQLSAPMGAIYAFPGVDLAQLPNFDDEIFALRLLEEERVLIVPGSSFNVPYKNHFRITLLPEAAVMQRVFDSIERVLQNIARRAVAA
jgi:alanine-synthesizing transaminase